MNPTKLNLASVLIVFAAAIARLSSVAQAQQPAAAVPEGAVVAKLANGAGIELLGVCDSPSREKAWWKPDGSPLAIAPYRRGGMSVTSPGNIVREIALRVITTLNGSTEAAAVDWSVPGSNSTAVSDDTTSLYGAAVAVGDDPDGMTLRADIAAGPWTTQFATVGTGGNSQATKGIFGLGAHSVLWGTPVEDHGTTRLMVASTGLGAKINMRVIAIDQTGAEHSCTGFNGANDGSTIMQYCKANLAPADIKQWKLQTRAYDQWVEIRHIALHAGLISTVQVVTSDNP